MYIDGDAYDYFCELLEDYPTLKKNYIIHSHQMSIKGLDYFQKKGNDKPCWMSDDEYQTLVLQS